MLLLSAMMVAQAQAPRQADALIALDPLLYNGKYYTYSVQSSTQGSQFFTGSGYTNGTVHIHGLAYDHLSLNFDLVNQELVLEYKIENSGVKHIVISDAWLESFQLGEYHFKMLEDEDSMKHIYQVVGHGVIQVLYAWYKELKLDSRPGAKSFYFSNPMKRSYVYIHEDPIRYFNNKSFVADLDPFIKSNVKKYIGQHKIKVMKTGDQEMTALLDFINLLLAK